MKKAVTILVLFNVLMLDFIALGFIAQKTLTIGFLVMGICFRSMQLSWIVFAIWFLWPYIKRGISYLINHRED